MYSLFKLKTKGEFLYCFRPHEAYLYYKYFRINLLTGQKEKYAIHQWIDSWKDISLEASFSRPKVIHLFFELGHMLNDLASHCADHVPLGIALDYTRVSKVTLNELWPTSHDSLNLKFLEVPTYHDYRASFEKVQEFLKKGDCYQVNLTRSFYLSFTENYHPKDFIKNLFSKEENIGAYAHATYLRNIDLLLLSNSPECLVQKKITKNQKTCLYSMPIKGSLKMSEGESFEKAWDKLQRSVKDEGELDMITDLIRNDLSRVDLPLGKVLARKRPLKVPGLLHQYSLIASEVGATSEWKKIFSSLFPGGSISGAPKKRVLEIIHQLEYGPRGFYCGSTLLCYKSIMSASINIRSAEVDFVNKEVRYGAGGGITLLSQPHNEYQELLLKTKSFLSLLGKSFLS